MADNIPGLIDYDFGAGTYHLPAGTGPFVLKMDASANFIWARSTAQITTAPNAQSYASSIALDGAGNIYSTGNFYAGTYDFDPGAASFPIVPESVDIYVSKLDANGNFRVGQ